MKALYSSIFTVLFMKPIIILGFLLIISLNANAAIISGLETHTTSDGSVVDLSGLDWLSWDETQGQSTNDVEGGVFFDSGWRYATIAEYIDLMSSVYISYGRRSDTSNADGGQWLYDNMFGDPAMAVDENNGNLSIFGGTQECPVGKKCRGKFYLQSDDWFKDGVVVKSGGLWTEDYNGSKSVWYSAKASRMTSALVRDAAVVPEPSTLTIFALGLIGLAARRFKKQS